MVVGFLIGTFFGAVPGLTAVLAIALLLPITYSLDVTAALVMCASIFMSGMYAGSITATTINIPGAPSSMMTGVEGYPLMQQGHGANALGHAALGSMIGGTIGAIFLILFTPIAAQSRSAHPDARQVLADPLRAGRHRHLPARRHRQEHRHHRARRDDRHHRHRRHAARGALHLRHLDTGRGHRADAVVIGTFAISELLIQARDVDPCPHRRQGACRQAHDQTPRLRPAAGRDPGDRRLDVLKSAIIGFFIGVLPGAGGSMAAFVSYADAMRRSKRPELYGKGSREGIAAAETANNSMCGGAFVPMLMFGIPGDPTTAIVLGVLDHQRAAAGPAPAATTSST